MKIQKHLIAILLIFLGSVLIGTSIYHTVEGWRVLDSAYFVVVTMTTIGYGDFVPQTDIGKVLTMFFSFFGIAMTLYLISLIAGTIFKKRINKKLIKMGGHRRVHELEKKLIREIEMEEREKIKKYEAKLKNKLKKRKKPKSKSKK